ncbi:MAG: hypothetical protein R8P61_00655 [Bacteroidia bacterium]|nr:hypothetical protein [Bacteroidia bacterium]
MATIKIVKKGKHGTIKYTNSIKAHLARYFHKPNVEEVLEGKVFTSGDNFQTVATIGGMIKACELDINGHGHVFKGPSYIFAAVEDDDDAGNPTDILDGEDGRVVLLAALCTPFQRPETKFELELVEEDEGDEE